MCLAVGEDEEEEEEESRSFSSNFTCTPSLVGGIMTGPYFLEFGDILVSERHLVPGFFLLFFLRRHSMFTELLESPPPL